MAPVHPLRTLLLAFSGWIGRRQSDVIDYLREENRVLRERLEGRSLRLNDDQRRRLAARAKLLDRKTLERVATIVTPDTLMRWHRRLIALKWTFERKGPGRPGILKVIQSSILRMAAENPAWGYARIQGELLGLGHRVARSTIAKVLKEHGIPPSPDRPSSWRSFLRAHWGRVAAMDFLTEEVWTPRGQTQYVLFTLDLATRRVELAGITPHPTEAFVAQVARNLIDPVDGFLRGHRVLICDRDTKFTERFAEILDHGGVSVVRTPHMAPNCNAFAERFVLSLRRECLDRMIFFGRRRLRNALRAYVEHYNTERPHQGIGNERLSGNSQLQLGPVRCRERLGGLLKHYYRTPA